MDLQGLLVAGGIGAIIIMQGFILSKLNKIDSVSEKTQRHEITLFGPEGNNGLVGTSKAHGHRLHALERAS